MQNNTAKKQDVDNHDMVDHIIDYMKRRADRLMKFAQNELDVIENFEKGRSVSSHTHKTDTSQASD